MSIVNLPNIGGGSDPATINVSVLNGKVDPLATDYNGNIQNVNIAAGAGIVYSKLTLTDGILNADINSSAAIVASKLSLSGIAQTVSYIGAAENWAKGSDIASATTTDIGAATGNSLDVTGTTTITGLGIVQAGTLRNVRFTGALILTHNGTSLILPTGANITTAAGDTATFISLGSGNWYCKSFQRKDGTALTGATAATSLAGSVVQTVKTTYATFASLGTTAIVLDDTIPTWAEGNEITGLSTTITPNSNSNFLIIDVVAHISKSGVGGNVMAISAYRDPSGTDPAISTSSYSQAAFGTAGNTPMPMVMSIVVTSPGTSAVAFKFRVGLDSTADTIVINGKGAATAARIFGGALISTVIIKEIKG